MNPTNLKQFFSITTCTLDIYIVSVVLLHFCQGIPTEEEAFNFFVGKETMDHDKKGAEDTEEEPEVI